MPSALACSDEPPSSAGAGGTQSPTATASGDETASGTETSTTAAPGSSESSSSTPSTSSGAVDSTTGGPEPLCEEIAVSLVMDHQAPIFALERRRAVARFLDDLTEQTGARVRVFPMAGAPQPPRWNCSFDDEGPAAGLTVLWGEDGRPKLSARPQLDCIYQGVKNLPGNVDGDWMFTGLMFPILEHADWPPPTRSLALSMMLAETDDDEGGMYARPGMASEAFLRLAAQGDRDRAVSFSIGDDADELHTFALSLGPHSAHFDWKDTDLPEALEAYLPVVVDACANVDAPTVPQPPGGCEHIDILFVVDGSASMAAEQAALRGLSGPPVFAEFTDALALSLDSLEDIHVGVVSSEPGDVVLHTHRDQPAQPPDATTDCGLSQPWLVAPSAQLEAQFSCIAATTATSTLESTTRNAAEALLAPQNAGFVRDDSVLFVVLLTDEDTTDLGPSRVEVREQILSAVGGDLSRVVVLAIAGDQGVFEMPKTTCFGPYGTATPGRRITSIVRSFRDQGIGVDICQGDFATAFGEALDELVQACISFQPEG